MQIIEAHEDRIARVTVCTRPFRAQGPRIEAEQVGDKLVVHHYGHGGSGWSLSWGSGARALALALAGRDPSLTDIAVIGCGAIGLTSAILAQQAGVRSVTIYAKHEPTETRSFRATGAWTPDSRVALATAAHPAFADEWERMARTSWSHFDTLLRLPGSPVQMQTRYILSHLPPDLAEREKHAADPIGFALYNPRLHDLAIPNQDLAPGTHRFPSAWVRRNANLIFHVTELVQHLTGEFERHGGKLVLREFHTPADLAQLPQPVVLHSTGYGARSLFGDQSLTPVRGQIGWLPAQSGIDYSLYTENLNVVPRRDGIVVQIAQQGEASGWNRDDERPNQEEARAGVAQLRSIMEHLATNPA